MVGRAAQSAASPQNGRKSRRQPVSANYYQRGISAGQRAFHRPDMGRIPHPHEFELYYDV